jgi:hypothetical protein
MDADFYDQERARLHRRLLAALVAVLALTLGLGAGYSRLELSRRDGALAEIQQMVTLVSDANLTLQGQVGDLVTQRDDASVRRDTMLAERDTATGLREQQQGQVAVLQQQVGDLQLHAADLEQALAESERQLSQAREEGARQQRRAQDAETVGVVLAEVIRVDNQITQEFLTYRAHMVEVQRALGRGDTAAATAATQRADQSARRLDELFAQRRQAAEQLP